MKNHAAVMMMEDKSLFVEFFGDYPLIRVLDFLIEQEGFDYSEKEICKYANVSWNTLKTFWEKLVKTKIVVPTRKIGKVQMYKLNTENPIVKQLMELDNKLMKISLEEAEEKAKAYA
jgi:hypothetical protein